MEWVLFSDPQTHVQGVKNMISGAIAVIHGLTHLYFEGCVAALGLRPQKISKRVPDVHPEVSHYPPSPPDTVARCAAKAHPSLGGASLLVGGILWKGRG